MFALENIIFVCAGVIPLDSGKEYSKEERTVGTTRVLTLSDVCMTKKINEGEIRGAAEDVWRLLIFFRHTNIERAVPLRTSPPLTVLLVDQLP